MTAPTQTSSPAPIIQEGNVLLLSFELSRVTSSANSKTSPSPLWKRCIRTGYHNNQMEDLASCRVVEDLRYAARLSAAVVRFFAGSYLREADRINACRLLPIVIAPLQAWLASGSGLPQVAVLDGLQTRTSANAILLRVLWNGAWTWNRTAREQRQREGNDEKEIGEATHQGDGTLSRHPDARAMTAAINKTKLATSDCGPR